MIGTIPIDHFFRFESSPTLGFLECFSMFFHVCRMFCWQIIHVALKIGRSLVSAQIRWFLVEKKPFLLPLILVNYPAW